VKFLIAGLGSIGRRHLRNLLALGETDIVLFRTHRSSLPDDELDGFPVETDLEAALEKHRPQAAIIANPTALHLEAAIPAARAGCHLLLEKPVSHSLEGLDELEAALREGGGQALVGYQFRYHPGLIKAAKLLRDGAIGRPLAVSCLWGEYLPDWHPWEDYRRSYSARAELGGGVILTLSHTFDYLAWLLGPVQAVWAFAGSLSDLELNVEDTAEIGLQFAKGALGSVQLNYHRRPPAHRFEISGTEGVMAWDNQDGALHMQAAGKNTWQEYQPPAGFQRNDLFQAQMSHFLEVARMEGEPACSLADGRRALELSLAALESAANGRLVRLG
jgi:predicted dehydrogenase